jgi:hypothetical protein
MVIPTLRIVPTSPPALSLAPKLHVPFRLVVLMSGVNVAAVGANPAGAAAARLPSGANVPVNGAVPDAKDTTDVELITVFVKLSFNEPLWLTRFKTCAFGAFKNKVRSPSQVWVMLKITLALVPVAPPGIPATVIGTDTPVGSESGITTLIAPVLPVAVPDKGAPITVSKVGLPAQSGPLGLAETVIGATTVGDTVIVGVPV